MTHESYGIKVTTLLNAAQRLTEDLDYLCSVAESVDPEFPLRDALAYSRAVVAISSQLDFVIEDLSENDLSDDEMYVRLSKEEIYMLNNYTENTDDALAYLEETCGISLQSN